MASSQVENIRRVLVRDLKSLRAELDAYENDSQIWALPDGLKNSAGTLSLHLTGNLRHFIGAQIGQSGYLRDREYEFAARDLARHVLAEQIDAAIADVESALNLLTDSDLELPFPITVGGHQFTIGRFLTHLTAHFAYHLGQIDYHRRIVTGNSAGIEAQSLDEL